MENKFNLEQFPDPEEANLAEAELFKRLSQCVAEFPDIFAAHRTLEGDISYIIKFSPESRLPLLEKDVAAEETLKSRHEILSKIISRLRSAIQNDLLKDVILKSEVEKRLLRLEIYLAGTK